MLTAKKKVFSVNTHALSMAVASKQCALTPAIRGYFFACAAQVLIMFLHDFR
jgi:hypothetical protein